MVKKIDPKVAEKVMLKAGLRPKVPYINSNTKWKCECLKCGNIVFPKYTMIQRGQGGCRSCGYNKSSEKRKIDQKAAIAIMVKVKLKPLEPYKGAGSPWICKCLICGNITSPSLHSIKKGSGCKYCSGNAKLNPESAEKVMLKAGLKPLEKYKNSSHKWKSRCLKCKKIVNPTYSAIQHGQGSCVYCAGNKIDEKDAIKIMLASNLKPLEPYIKNSRAWKSRCLKCKKIVSPTYSAIQQGQGGCVYCSGKKVDPSDAVKLMLKAKLKPLESYKSHNTKWKCKCLNCGKIVFPRYDSVKTGQGGCRYCANAGINMNTRSYLYLITHQDLNSHKVGMGNHKKLNDRLGKFNKDGWKTFKVWEMKTGSQAIDIEAEVFRILRKDMKLPIHLTKAHMSKTEGHTETVNADSITLIELERIIKRVIKEWKNKGLQP